MSLVSSSNSDLVILTETWLTADVTDAELFDLTHDFVIFRRDRPSGRGGGVLIAAKRNLFCSTINVPTALEILWVNIKAFNSPLLVGVCYRPPHSDPSFPSILNDTMNVVTHMFPRSKVFLFGDFNYPGVDWHQLTVVSSNNKQECSDFLEMCFNHNLTQVVTEPTRLTDHTSNILDLILTSHPDSLTSLSYLRELSDHKVIHATISSVFPKKTIQKKRIVLYDKGNYEAINSDLLNFANHFLPNISSRSVDDNWRIFTTHIRKLVETFIPTISIATNSLAPWFNNTLKRLNNRKKRLFRSAKRKATDSSWNLYYAVEKEYNVSVGEAKFRFVHFELPKMLKECPRKFWRTLNPKFDSLISLSDDSNFLVDSSECANLLNRVFSSIFTFEPADPLPQPELSHHTQMNSITFSPNGIASIIDSLKLSSSTGVDEINTKILKNTKNISSVILTEIFSQSLSLGTLPGDWKVGKVVPVFKKGDRHSPDNYRPISLTCVASKIMEHCIYSHVIRFLEDNNFIHPSQHGFRKGLSCETQLASFIHDLHVNLDSNVQTDVIFLDFAKAFDKVPHQRLMLKLSHLNLDPCVLNWIEAFLTAREQYVTANDFSSNRSPVSSGVPQGSVLGPLLFLIYINDLPKSVASHIRLFADDCVLYSKITNPSDHVILQHDLHSIQAWCGHWLMTLNTDKCKLVSFHRRANPMSFNYSINGASITSCTSYKYLGVHITSCLSWAEHINHITSNANKTLGFLKRNLKHAPPHLKLAAYTTLVRPKLEYASAIWSPHQSYLIYTLEAIQNRAVRFIYSDYSSTTSVTSLKARADLHTLSSRRRLARLSLFHKFFYNPGISASYVTRHSRASPRFGHHLNVFLPTAKTVTFFNSFFLQSASEWNDLPHSLVACTDAAAFKEAIAKCIREVS